MHILSYSLYKNKEDRFVWLWFVNLCCNVIAELYSLWNYTGGSVPM